MSNINSLPGIKKIWYITIDLLPDDVVYRAVAGLPVTVSGIPTDIILKGDATCDVEQQYDNNAQIEKAKLNFYTLDEIPTTKHLAFVIHTVNGEKYIVGSKEKPYATVKMDFTTGKTDGDAAVRKYEVAFTAKKALARFED